MDPVEDILSDALEILGGERVDEGGLIQYGPLRLTVAPKEGKVGVELLDRGLLQVDHAPPSTRKANTLLADHLFSPALVLAELVERGILQVSGRHVVELGAGCALPSLLAATMILAPSLIVVTDYPDDGILGNLEENVERNKAHYRPSCRVRCMGYEWGTDTTPLLNISERVRDDTLSGYDVVIMSDLLHFDSSHDVLVRALTMLLAKSALARAYVAAGNYTAPRVCDRFLSLGVQAGLMWEEGTSEGSDGGLRGETWSGSMIVSGLDVAQLSARKRMCRWWIGRWMDV